MGLVHSGDLTIHELVYRLTIAPATILGGKFGQCGTLAAGVPADITIFDPNKKWVVAPEVFVSRGKNTPLVGVTLKGKVMATILEGKMVYKDDMIAN
jgi:dihydroorotase